MTESKDMNRTNTLKKIGIALLGVLLLLLVIYGGFRFLKATVFLEDEETPKVTTTKTIERDGIKYFPKQDIETILLIAVDGNEEMAEVEDSQNGIVANEMMVVILDKTNETINMISLDRDIMTDVPIVGKDGKKTGTTYGQLGLAYSYGDGMETSCLNTIDAVSSLIYGIEIDHFISFNMEAMRILNDTTDEVTYDDEDLSISDVFLALKDVAENDPTVIISKYKDLSKYIVTDCSITAWASIFNEYGQFELQKIIYPDGKYKYGEDMMEYYLDEDNFQQIVLKYLFVEKQ